MSEPSPSKAEQIARRYTRFAKEHPWILLAFYIALTVGAGLGAKFGLSIQTSLEVLLPEGTSSVAALAESRKRTGSTDMYTVVITSPDPEANIKALKAIQPRIEKWPETEWTQIDRDTSFFSDHALLYLPMEDLTKIRDQLEEEIKLEKRRLNPFYVDLRRKEEIDADNEKRWALNRWVADDLALRLGLDQELFDSILSPDKLGLPNQGEDAQKSEAKDKPAANTPPKPVLPDHLRPYLISEDGTVAVMLCKLSQPATDVVKSKELYDRGEKLLEDMNVTQFHPEMRGVIAGAYRNFNEVKSISNDSTVATIISVFLVLFILIGFFRNARSVLVLLYPLVHGIVWSIGLTALTIGRLNISTLFVFTMLIGMGIDFGIHFYARIQEEYKSGKDYEESIVQAILHSGRAMLSAALTTIVALLTLLTAHFQGFVEFGVIASYGIGLCLVSFILVIPPALFALEKVWATKRPKAAENTQATVRKPASDARMAVIRKVAFSLMFVGSVGGAIAMANWEKASFEYNFRNLRGPSTGTGISYGKAVGRGKSTSPSMILGQNQEEMRQVHESLTQRFLKEKGEGYLKSFVTIQTYVPPGQKEKYEVIKDIQEMVNDRKLNRSKGTARKLIDRMRDLSKAKPFTVEEIPSWAQRSITERDGRIGAIGYLYSNVKKWDASDVQRFQDQLGVISTDSGRPVSIASSGFILADVIRTVKSDALSIMPIAFAVIFFMLLLDLRSFKGAFVCLSSMGIALLWTIGGMVLFDIRLGLYNMIVLPMVLGTGIDGSIHIYHRYRETGSRHILHVLKTTGVSVIAASSTTLAGFVGLLFVQHKGVKSIGDLAVVGILATLIAVISFMPGLLLLVFPPSKDDPALHEEPQDQSQKL